MILPWASRLHTFKSGPAYCYRRSGVVVDAIFQLILHVDVVSKPTVPTLIIYTCYINCFSLVTVSFYFSSIVKLRFVNICTNKRLLVCLCICVLN